MRTPMQHIQVAVAAAILAAPFGAAAAQTIAITGAKVYPVRGAPIENGTVLIRDGRIAAVGATVDIPADAQRVDARGKVVTPGFINSGTQLGLVDIGFASGPTDQAARGKEQVAAAFRVWDGLNPANIYIAPARQDGITSVVVAPGGGQLIAGQAALIDNAGTTAAEMVRRAPVAMLAQVGNSQGAGVGARGELLGKVREVLGDARDYARRRSAFESGQTREFAASRADLEALQPVLAGRVPMVIAADRASDITAALNLAKDFGLRIMIAGGAEAWEVAPALAAAKVPVITGAMNNIPGDFSSLGMRQENAAILARAGVPVALVGNAGGGDEELFNVRNVRFEAGNAVAYGMAWDAALRAVTLTPAELFGVSDKVGALAPGMDANVVVWSGDPFEFATRAEHVYVRGVEDNAPTRQDLLTARYNHLPPEYTQP